MPKITVLMTVYNSERYLRQAIDSILGQTFRDYEFLIINDGCTDGSRNIIRSYDDPRIRLIDNSAHRGQTKSLNQGLQLATGEFIARQDADDISQPDRLGKQVSYLETHGEVALLGTCYTKIDVEGNSIAEEYLPYECTELRWCLLFFCPFVHSSVVIKKSALLEIGVYDQRYAYAQDYDLWSRIARSLPVANLRDRLVKYRITPWSMTNTYGMTVDNEILNIRMVNIGHLLGASRTKEIKADDVRDMISLLDTPWTDGYPGRAIEASKTIFRLHRAFCQYYRISPIESQSYRANLGRRIGRNLVGIGHRCFDEDTDGARKLLLEAFRLYAPIMIEKSFTELLLKLLVGRDGVRAIRRLLQKTTGLTRGQLE